jgi:polyisoprenyl-phosphate glycosyltransferase
VIVTLPWPGHSGPQNPMPSSQTLAILVPVFNEEQCVPLFFDRLRPVLESLNESYQVLLVFLNNASTDGTLAAIAKVRDRHPETYVITLSRNVGYQRSLEFGLKQCHADLFVFIDADCEDPPEMIRDFVDKHRTGFDIVYGERIDRSEAIVLKVIRKFFYRILRAIADEDIVLDMAEFSLITAEVRNAIIADHSSYPFIRASIGRVGYRRYGIPYRRQPRIAGSTHYNLWRMTTFAIGGLLAASTLLLRVVVYALPVWMVAMLWLTWHAALGHAGYLAWLIFLGFAYCGGAAGFVCLYLARVYKNTLGRPNAFLDHRQSQLPPTLGPVCQ